MPIAAIVRQTIRQMRPEDEVASPSLDVLLEQTNVSLNQLDFHQLNIMVQASPH